MTEKQSLIRRIVVALDASPASRYAIQTAVDLAARFDAELIGLFVEDINLLQVTRLPFVREVRSFSLTARRLDAGDLRRQLRAQAEQMRQTLAMAAELRGISWEFRVKRGSVVSEIMTAGLDADLMVIGRAGRSLTTRGRMGSTVRTMVLQRSGLTFILTSKLRLTSPAIVLYDGSALGRKALELAGSLVVVNDRRLAVLLVAENRKDLPALREQAFRLLSDLSLSTDFRMLLRPSHSHLTWLVQALGGGPVVLPCVKEGLQGELLCRLVDEIPNPVLLVR